jgi:RimJ/RimL family protein N-acetyltransferase
LSEHGDLLRGRHARLIALMPEHYRALYDVTLEPQVSSRWEPSAQGGSFEAWARRLSEVAFCQYGIQVANSPRAVDGLARCYGANFRHGTAQVAVFTSARTHCTGAGLEAAALLVDFLFRKFPFRKLYAETLEFNLQQFSTGVGRFFEVEGVLRAHEIHDGQAWDNYVLGISREFWMEHGARFAARLRHSATGHTEGST